MFNILDILFPKYCLSCNREGEYFCSFCKEKPFKKWDGQLNFTGEKYFDELYCVGDYEDEILGSLIKTCKYRFVKEIAHDLGLLLAQVIKSHDLQGMIIPVPLSPRRERWRGFNQAAEIAKVAAQELSLEYRECLKRVKHKKAQAKLSETERLKNMNGCFEIKGTVPQTVILIDDVITTGSTLNECARVLKQNGTERIIVAVLAKG